MAKLRKMLGDVNAPYCSELMRMIESQSKATLARWAAGYAREHYLPIYQAACPENATLAELLSAVDDQLKGALPLKEFKLLLKEARTIPQGMDDRPAAQAAARAITTACAVLSSPTSALGFTFYGAAAFAYDRAGTAEKPAVYDALAVEEYDRILASLRAALIPDEPDPVKVKWGC